MTAESRLPHAGWFVDMARGSNIVFFALRVQPDLAYEYFSDAVVHLIGVTPAEGTADASVVNDCVDPEYREIFAEALGTPPGEQAIVELKWRHRDTGRVLYTRCWLQARERADGSVILEGTVSEITELREVETELRRSEQRHRLLAENAYDVIWTMDLAGKVTYVSPAVLQMRGLTPEEARNQTLEEIHPPESAASVGAYYQQVFDAIRDGVTPPSFRGEHEYYRKDGSIMIGELQVIPHVDDDGQVLELLGVTRDVSERRRYETELNRLAATDAVTGAWNRRRGEEMLAGDVEAARHNGDSLCLLMVDIDRFKPINDTFGHQCGDRVLGEVAQRLRESVRASDAVVRWGGDEFLILLRDCKFGDATAVAEALRSRVANLRFSEIGPLTVSIGAAKLQPGDDAGTLLERADAALYEAKRTGRNTVVG